MTIELKKTIVGTLKSLLIEKAHEGLSINLQITLLSGEERKIVLFKGCRALKFGEISCDSCLVMNIYDITSWQNEDLAFKVKDDEEEMIEFFCKEVIFDGDKG